MLSTFFWIAFSSAALMLSNVVAVFIFLGFYFFYLALIKNGQRHEQPLTPKIRQIFLDSSCLRHCYCNYSDCCLDNVQQTVQLQGQILQGYVCSRQNALQA
jgi:hypothetical protein